MVGREIHKSVSMITGLVPLARTASGDGQLIDLEGYESCLVVFSVGDNTASAQIQPTILESDDSATGFTTATAASIVGTAPLIDTVGEGNKSYAFAYIGSKRYIKIRDARLSGSSCSTSAVVIRGNPRRVPTTHGT